LEYVRGWRRETSLYEALCEGHRGAEAAGFVKVGPQRGDLAVRREGGDVRGFFSRGQQKLLLYALQAAAERVCRERGTTPAVFLADDWRAELDGDNAADLLRLLESLQGQVVMTGTEGGEELGDGSSPVRMFHVEQGRVSDSAVSL
jgi:DNA replication and repair protein RecF